ncbi:MAG: acyl-CoA dehydrogenase family protein [Janthinobacterium lividum]
MNRWNLWDWPFFEPRHHELAARLREWQQQHQPLDDLSQHSPYLADEARALARELAEWGFLEFALPRDGGVIDVRAVCLIREALAYRSALADNTFVMQGLGTAPLWLAGSVALRERYLDACRRGEHLAAIAVTEPEAGSDVAAIATTAQAVAGGYVLNGSKIWITNAGAADHYIVIARTGEAPGARGLSAFMVDAGTPGLTIGPHTEMIAPHPIAGFTLTDCRVPAGNLIGGPGEGFKAAMATFDIFRTSVGAAAIGMARRAMDEALARVSTRHLFGKTMSALESVQTKLAEMALDTESGALLVYRAAWQRDVRGGRVSREVAMAKLGATEAAQRVIDAAVQLFGGQGVARGCIVEQLYRDIRPLRIYEGASEVQKLVIARALLAALPKEDLS